MEKFFAILFGVGATSIFAYFTRDKIGEVFETVSISTRSFATEFLDTNPSEFLYKTGDNSMSKREEIIEEARAEMRRELELEEGYRTTVYLDTRGLATVGIGHLVLPQDNLKVGDVISDARVEEFYRNDSEKAFQAAIKQADDLGRFTPEFIVALVSVNYQLGTGWTSTFRNTYNKLRSGDWQGAIANLRVSRWAEQTPRRVANFTAAIEDAFTTSA